MKYRKQISKAKNLSNVGELPMSPGSSQRKNGKTRVFPLQKRVSINMRN